MTYGSFGWAMMERARGAQQGRDTDFYKAQTDRINALKANGIGAAKPATAAAPAATPAKQPTFSNISATGSGIGVLPNAFGQASPTTLPINEGQPGSGTIGRTMYTTDAAGKVTVPERAGYQTTPDPMVGGTSEAFKDSMQENIGFKKGTEYVRKGITKVKDKTGNGSPTEDTVDAKLAEGEAVLNAGAAELIGREGIAELNKRGLKDMGMEGAEPEFVDGEVRAYAGIDFNDPAMKANAQNMEMRRRMAAGVRQPVANPSLVQSAPIQATPVQPAPAAAPQKIPTYSVTEMGDPYTKEELVRNAERAKVAQAAARAAPAAAGVARPSIAARAINVGGKALRVAGSAPAAGIMAMLQSGEAGAAADDLDFAPGGRFRTAPAAAAAAQPEVKATGESMTPGDAMRLRRPAEPQYSQQVPVPAGYVAPKAQVFAARGVTKEDRSNYDLAEQGFGSVVRKPGNVYTDSGKNPYLDQQFKEQDGLTGKQLMERRIATDESRRIEAAAKDEQAKLDALEAADPRVRIARIEKEGTAAEKKAAQDAAVNYAREQNPNLTKVQETAIRYGVKDVGKNDAYKIEMGEVAQALGIPAVDDEGKPIADLMTGRQVVNRNIDAERKFFAWMKQSGIKDTNQGLALYLSSNAGGTQAPKSFSSTAEVEAAAAAGQIKAGDKVIVNGRQATWQ